MFDGYERGNDKVVFISNRKLLRFINRPGGTSVDLRESTKSSGEA